VIHGDVTVDNTLVDDRHRVTGIVDLGDMSHTAMVCDVTSAWASMLWRRRGEDIFRAAAALLDGYESITPLEDLERSLLADLLAARAAAGASISALRVARYPDNEYIAGFADEAWPKLELYDELGPEEAARRFGGRSWTTAVPVPDLMQRRRARLGSALTEPTYDRPLHLVRGQGVWLIDAGGRRFLDAYNNVPVVGHCHPRVTEALVRQARALNTNMRYLHEAVIELAERLVESMPPDSGLDTVMMVNSGSEANDLAWRLATEVTGRTGGIVSEHAYHGVSWAIANLSPEAWPRGRRPSFVETFPPPDSYRADVVTSEGFERAVERLRSRDVSPAAVFVDGAFTSDGIFPPTPQHLSEIVDLTRQAGALYVADEVQVGHGRTGEHLWSFAASGIVPDIVTLGKPMGNGYPVAAMITRHELVDRFARETEFFSTFGGNPPAAVAALAVLDVIRDEGLVNHAQSIGAELRLGILQLADGHVSIGDVRGWGLLVGIDFVKSLGTREPDPASAENVANSLRERGVLVGITGRHDNVLKVRPPLIFGSEHVQLLLHELRDVLDASAVE
jgi:4-aminobutyrate aminotransferase-like enzyme